MCGYGSAAKKIRKCSATKPYSFRCEGLVNSPCELPAKAWNFGACKDWKQKGHHTSYTSCKCGKCIWNNHPLITWRFIRFLIFRLSFRQSGEGWHQGPGSNFGFPKQDLWSLCNTDLQLFWRYFMVFLHWSFSFKKMKQKMGEPRDSTETWFGASFQVLGLQVETP